MKHQRPKKNQENKKKRTGRRLFLAGVILAAAALITGLTMAKYVHQWESDPALADARAFYFTSDLLKESGTDSYKLYSWGDGIKIKLQNFEDVKRISETDIAYTVTCDDGKGTVEDKGNGKMSKGSASENLIVIHPEPGAKSVTVRAKATAPYEKELTATFELEDTSQPMFQIVDTAGEAAAELIIKGGNKTQRFSMSWDSGLLAPDRTNPLFQAGEGSSAFIEITASGSGSILLFKNDPAQNYSLKEQEITKESGTGIISLKISE